MTNVFLCDGRYGDATHISFRGPVLGTSVWPALPLPPPVHGLPTLLPFALTSSPPSESSGFIHPVFASSTTLPGWLAQSEQWEMQPEHVSFREVGASDCCHLVHFWAISSNCENKTTPSLICGLISRGHYLPLGCPTPGPSAGLSFWGLVTTKQPSQRGFPKSVFKIRN